MENGSQPPDRRTVTVRRGERRDVHFLARVMELASTPPFERSMMDRYLERTSTSTVDFLAAVLEEGAFNWGTINEFIVLEVDGEAAAACSVYDPDPAAADHSILNLDLLPRIVDRFGWQAHQVDRFREMYAEDWNADDQSLRPQADAIIEAVAVLPGFRGLSLGTRLIEEAFAEARGRGHNSIGIMVIHGNDRAQRLYERHFEPYITYHAAFFGHAFPGVTKYRAVLGSGEAGS